MMVRNMAGKLVESPGAREAWRPMSGRAIEARIMARPRVPLHPAAVAGRMARNPLVACCDDCGDAGQAMLAESSPAHMMASVPPPPTGRPDGYAPPDGERPPATENGESSSNDALLWVLGGLGLLGLGAGVYVATRPNKRRNPSRRRRRKKAGGRRARRRAA